MAKIKVTIERGGETVTSLFDEGATIQAVMDGDHLRGANDVGVLNNGRPATAATKLKDGDRVTEVPKSGTQGH